MEEQRKLIELLFEKTQQLVHTTAELYKLKFIEKSSEVLSSLVSKLIVLLFLTIFFLIFNIGVALWIGDCLKQDYWGFFIVSGFYGLIALLLYIFRKQWIKEPVKNSIISHSL